MNSSQLNIWEGEGGGRGTHTSGVSREFIFLLFLKNTYMFLLVLQNFMFLQPATMVQAVLNLVKAVRETLRRVRGARYCVTSSHGSMTILRWPRIRRSRVKVLDEVDKHFLARKSAPTRSSARKSFQDKYEKEAKLPHSARLKNTEQKTPMRKKQHCFRADFETDVHISQCAPLAGQVEHVKAA